MVGLVLGSFDPPHKGHLQLSVEAIGSRYVDLVLYIPAYQNPWKSGKQLPWEHRREMLRLAISELGDRRISVWDIEKEMFEATGEPPCTFDVLQEVSRRIPEFRVITTIETFSEVPRFKNGESVLRDTKFLVFRPPHMKDIPDIFELLKPGDLISDIQDFPDICSTKIREAIRQGLPTSEWLVPSVQKYIRENELYV